MERVRLDRQALYDLVWSVPMQKLAARYGMSDVALAKICKRMNVPRPTRGYWAQLQAGNESPRPPLPPSTPGDKAVCQLRGTPRPMVKASPVLPVVPRLDAPHPLIANAARAAASARTDHYGQLELKQHGLRVSPEALTRALCLLDTLIKYLVGRGYQAESQMYGIHIRRDRISERIELREAIDRRRREGVKPLPKRKPSSGLSTREEILERLRPRPSPPQLWDYMPSGRLIIEFARLRWKDTKKKQLEDRLGSVAAAIEAVIERQHEELTQKLRAVRAEAEGLARKEWEEVMAHDLLDKAHRWDEAQRLQLFLVAAEEAFGEGDQRGEWIAWAKQHLVVRNPFTNPDEKWYAATPAPEAAEEIYEELVSKRAWSLGIRD